VGCCCERGNEPAGSITGRKFLNQLDVSQLLKEGSAPWKRASTNG
jgi:hypothetical protein